MWNFCNPVQIIAGTGSLQKMPDFVGNKKYVFITYDDAPFQTYIDEIAQIIGHAPVGVITGVEENPSLGNFRILCEKLQQLQPQPELLVAVGGGSVIDACKVLSAGAGDFEQVYQFILGQAELTHTLEYICVPTTSGTGSEVTCWATVWDPQQDRKHSLSHPSLYAQAAFLEPALTLSLPLSVTINTALDALSHALESLWNINRNPLSAALACTAARLIIHNLPLIVDAKNSPRVEQLAIRESLQNAALMAGVAFSNTKTSIAHNISYAITLERGIAHGIACSFTLPVIIRAIEKDPLLEQYIGSIFNASPSAAADQLDQLLKQLGIATHPQDYGYSAEQWAQLVSNAAAGQRGKNYCGSTERLIELFTNNYQCREEALCQQ